MKQYYIKKVIGRSFFRGIEGLKLISVATIKAETPQKAWKLVKDSLDKGEYRIGIGNGRDSQKPFIIE